MGSCSSKPGEVGAMPIAGVGRVEPMDPDVKREVVRRARESGTRDGCRRDGVGSPLPASVNRRVVSRDATKRPGPDPTRPPRPPRRRTSARRSREDAGLRRRRGPGILLRRGGGAPRVPRRGGARMEESEIRLRTGCAPSARAQPRRRSAGSARGQTPRGDPSTSPPP